MKDTPIKEQVHLQFRAEFFNLLNHANFCPSQCERVHSDAERRRRSNPTFGKITATTTSSRQIQFALKLMF